MEKRCLNSLLYMQYSLPSTISHSSQTDWYSEDFIYQSMVKYLKENGYKVQKDNVAKESGKIITATKFFKKEIIEVKGYPHYHPNHLQPVVQKPAHAKTWFTEALFNSFVNFSTFSDAEIAMAVPNVARYQAIIKNLNDYFTVNDLFFQIYLVNEDGFVEVSNLNHKYLKVVPQ